MNSNQKIEKVILHNPGVMWHNFEGYAIWNHSLQSGQCDRIVVHNPGVTGYDLKVMVRNPRVTGAGRILFSIIIYPFRIAPSYSQHLPNTITSITNKITNISIYSIRYSNMAGLVVLSEIVVGGIDPLQYLLSCITSLMHQNDILQNMH